MAIAVEQLPPVPVALRMAGVGQIQTIVGRDANQHMGAVAQLPPTLGMGGVRVPMTVHVDHKMEIRAAVMVNAAALQGFAVPPRITACLQTV